MSQPVYPEPPLEWPHYTIGFVAAVKRGFAKYATFRGRASRAEFWWWYLGYVIMVTAPLVLAAITVGATQAALGPDDISPVAVIFMVLALVVLLGLILPTVAAAVRRLHDTGQSGALACLWFIPYVGGLIVLILCAQRTSERAAQYGPPYPPGLPPGRYGSGYGQPNPSQDQPRPGPYSGPYPPQR